MHSLLPRHSVHLLVLQPTPFCNINCDYCYLNDRSSKRLMTLDTARRVFTHLREDELLAEGFELIWHAGEPLAAGVPFFRDAQHVINATVGDIIGCQTFQTNGMLIDDSWCELFSDIGAVVGVSLDGPEDLHDLHRKSRSGRGTHEQVMRGIRLLQAHDIDFYALCVLHAASLREPERLFEFFAASGIQRLGFNFEETEGIHTSHLFTAGDLESLTTQFLRYACDYTTSRNGIWVREFSDMLQTIRDSADAPTITHVNQPFSILTVGWDGRWSTFCPELISYGRAPNDFFFGNLNDGPLSLHADMKKFSAVARAVEEGIARCRSECEYFSVCGGGRPSNKFAEYGSFAASETQQCRLSVKRLADVCIDQIARNMIRNAEAISTPS